MINIQYYSHLLLNSKHSFLIKLTIFLAIYMLFYIDNIQDVAYCAKKQGAKKAAEIARAVPASEVSAVPFIAESKDEVVRGFHEQLRTIQIDSKAKHEEIITRLDDIKRLQTEKKQAMYIGEKQTMSNTSFIDPISGDRIVYPRFSYNEVENLNGRVSWMEQRFKGSIENNQRLIEQTQDLEKQVEHLRKVTSEQHREESRSLERMRLHSEMDSIKKHNAGLIKHMRELRQVNHALAKTIEEQDKMMRKLMAEQLPAYPEVKEIPSARQPKPENYEPNHIRDIESGRDVQRMHPAYPNNRETHTPADIYQYLGNCTIN